MHQIYHDGPYPHPRDNHGLDGDAVYGTAGAGPDWGISGMQTVANQHATMSAEGATNPVFSYGFLGGHNSGGWTETGTGAGMGHSAEYAEGSGPVYQGMFSWPEFCAISLLSDYCSI